MKKYVVKGKSIEELLEKVSKHLKVEKKDIGYEVVKEEKGMFGVIKEIELKVWLKNEEKVESVVNDESKKEPEVKIEIEVDVNKEKVKTVTDYLDIKVSKTGIFLMVNPEFRNFGFDDGNIIEEIAKRGIKNVKFDEVYKASNMSSGEYLKIAEYDPDFYKDAEIKMSVQNAKMEVVMEVIPPQGGNHIDYAKVMSKLKELNVVFGIKDRVIRDTIENKIYNKPIIVAEGKKQIQGTDAQIILMFNDHKDVEISADEEGKVDFTDINIFENVDKGQALARKIPSTRGEPGMTVYGELLEPKPGIDRKFAKGKNTEESEDGEYLLASISGLVSILNKKITVNEVLMIKENVDYSTGSISFIGSVQVRGKLLEGFTIKAEGDVIIEGQIEDAIIEAGGHVIAKSGIVGKEGGRGEIKCNGNLEAKFIENMHIKSQGSVIVQDSVVNSYIQAKEKIEVTHGKGKIMGGEMIAGKSISAITIGSNIGIATILEVGVIPEFRDKLVKLEKELSQALDERDKIEKELATLKKYKEEGHFNDKRQTMYLDLTKKSFIVLKNITNIKAEKEKVEQIFKNVKHGKINVIDKVFNGVSIRIGEQTIVTKEVFKFTTFYLNDSKNEIAILPCEIEHG